MMLKEATINDIKTIVNLERKILGATLGEAFLKHEILNHEFSHVRLFVQNDNVVGYISFRLVDNKAEMLNLLIDTPFQNQGFGTHLMLNAIDEIKNMGGESLILEVRSTNTRAIHFYEKLGFNQLLVRKNFYGDCDALVYMKEF